MFTMEELLSKRNQRTAFQYLDKKKDGVGIDGMHLSELKEYWCINHNKIEEDLYGNHYIPGIIKNYEIINGSGKKRIVSSLTVLDRFITRLLVEKFKRYINPIFLENSYAYQENKSLLPNHTVFLYDINWSH